MGFCGHGGACLTLSYDENVEISGGEFSTPLKYFQLPLSLSANYQIPNPRKVSEAVFLARNFRQL